MLTIDTRMFVSLKLKWPLMGVGSNNFALLLFAMVFRKLSFTRMDRCTTLSHSLSPIVYGELGT
jgi:hypothetical protein